MWKFGDLTGSFLDKLLNKNFRLSPESFKWKLLHIYLEKYSDVVMFQQIDLLFKPVFNSVYDITTKTLQDLYFT